MTHRQDMSGSNATDAVSVLLVSSIFMESLVLALSADMPAVIMRRSLLCVCSNQLHVQEYLHTHTYTHVAHRHSTHTPTLSKKISHTRLRART